jgi:hypothetical protein
VCQSIKYTSANVYFVDLVTAHISDGLGAQPWHEFLISAARNGRKEVVLLLLEHGADDIAENMVLRARILACTQRNRVACAGGQVKGGTT